MRVQGVFTRLERESQAGHCVACPTSQAERAAMQTPPPEAARPWYVCQTKPRLEIKAVTKLQEQGYEVYLPMLTHWERKKGAWRKTEQVMFPRYGFVRCGQRDQSLAPIRSTPGVTGLVRFGGDPATLNDETLATIRALAEQSEREQGVEAGPFAAGMPVAVAYGPLKGLTGMVSDVADERVAVLLTLLGREKRIVMPVNQLSTV